MARKNVQDMSREELITHVDELLDLLHLPYFTAQFVQGGRSAWEKSVQKVYRQSGKDVDE